MADNQLDILIRILTEQVGQEKAADVLKKVRDETQKSSKATEQATEATKDNTVEVTKQVSAKKQLHGVLKGLSNEFPVLGRVASLALNPIALAVAGIAGAFQLLRARINEATRTLAGFEMPDVSDSQLDRLRLGAEAMRAFAVEMERTRGAAATIKGDLAEVTRLIGVVDKLKKTMGISTGTEATEREIAAKEAAIAGISARLGGLGTPGSEAKEAALRAQYAAAAEAATKAQATARGRLGEIADVEGMGRLDPRRVYYDQRFRMRYGYGTSYDQARALEQANISSAQGSIDQFSAFNAASAMRAGRRTALSGGQAELERLQAEVTSLRSQAGISRTEAAASVLAGIPGRISDANATGNVAALTQALAEQNAALAQFVEAAQAVKRGTEAIQAGTSNLRRN